MINTSNFTHWCPPVRARNSMEHMHVYPMITRGQHDSILELRPCCQPRASLHPCEQRQSDAVSMETMLEMGSVRKDNYHRAESPEIELGQITALQSYSMFHTLSWKRAQKWIREKQIRSCHPSACSSIFVTVLKLAKYFTFYIRIMVFFHPHTAYKMPAGLWVHRESNGLKNRK